MKISEELAKIILQATFKCVSYLLKNASLQNSEY